MSAEWKPKVGDILYHCVTLQDEEDGKITTYMDEWHVRTVQNRIENKGYTFETAHRWAFLVQKLSWTWVKKSTKHFDYGWAKNIESWFKRKCLVARGVPSDLYKTKLQAAKANVKNLENELKTQFSNKEKDLEWHQSYIEELQRELPKAKAYLTKLAKTKEKNA